MGEEQAEPAEATGDQVGAVCPQGVSTGDQVTRQNAADMPCAVLVEDSLGPGGAQLMPQPHCPSLDGTGSIASCCRVDGDHLGMRQDQAEGALKADPGF